mgnify:CR=1 FL=1
MFRSFFLNRQWFAWSVLGSLVILLATWYKVQLDVQINEWFGDFYNTVQEALATPNSVELESFLAKCMTFAKIAGIYILVAVILEFFVRHYIFRWRTAMNDFYTRNWGKLHKIEGASQRVQADTNRFDGSEVNSFGRLYAPSHTGGARPPLRAGLIARFLASSQPRASRT